MGHPVRQTALSQAHDPRPQGGWDKSWYQVHTDIFEASFLPNGLMDLDVVCNAHVLVHLPDGSQWSATVFTVAEVERLMASWAGSDEALGGAYFRVPDALIVRNPGIDNITQVIAGLIETDTFADIFQRLNHGRPRP
ncbi:hypothetical protein OHB33_00080 [Streptomyces sp. NBC_01558]|nr:hypothetical protein [Streptomyces sp. NBC_01558]WSD74833.1 hypothetical protein OHB33_00080 [Streptomyces sp. NBC_01558]